MRLFIRGMAALTLLCCGFEMMSFGQKVQSETPLYQMPYAPSLDLESMDKGADPCQNFYQYACGGWMKKNPIPADQSSWDVYSKLDQDNERLLWGILEENAKATNRNPAQQKIGDFYATCMDTAAIDKLGLAPLQPEIDRIASLKAKGELGGLLARLQLSSNGTFFFNSGPSQDYGDASRMILEMGAGGLGLPDRDYYTMTDAKSVETRTKYLAYIEQILTMAGETPEHAHADAANIMRIETALAKASLTRVEQRDPYSLYHKMNERRFSELAPDLAWSDYFSALGVTGMQELNVSQPKFYQALNAVLEQEPVGNITAYLRFHLISANAAYLSSNFQQARFDFYSKYLRGTPEMPPRWKQCVRQTDRFLGEALGQEFVRQTFTPEMKAQTVKMTDEIEAAMGEEIEHLDWMSPATKQQALVKLHAIRNKIGYPDKWRDYSSLTIGPSDYFANIEHAEVFHSHYELAKIGKPVNRNEWGMTPPTVNAYYDPQMNDINFPAGVLQPPLYDAKLDAAPNYGDTGGTIGHELTHGFDDEGRQFDANGNLRDWWTKEDAAKFNDRIQCIRDQYVKYVAVDDIHINSKLTSGEDVADLGGEVLGYIAWKKDTEGQTLEARDGFSPDQRFFIGFSQWACGNVRPEQSREYAITDQHSPPQYRVNGVVVNMPEFQKAFACKAGEPMTKAARCKVW